MATLENQGYRRDLNLSETTDEENAIDNLMGTGVSKDLRYIQNNLRNISRIPFNIVDSNGFFFFGGENTLSINSLSSNIPVGTNNTRITIVLTHPYLLKVGNLVELTGITESTSLNGQYTVTSVSTDLTTIRVQKDNFTYENSSISISGVSFIHKPENIFTYTNDDVVNVSVATTFTVGAASTTLSKEIDYYVTQSNGINKFKLSKTPSSSVLGLSTITIANNAPADTPSGSGEFQFIRKDPVHQQQLINYIFPEIQNEDGQFTYIEGQAINETFDQTQSNIEAAEYFSIKKYRGDQSVTTSDSIKFEGSVVLNDPADYIVGSGVGNINAPGIYIGDTRAFSSDNNPWNKNGTEGAVGAALTTSSEEVSIGELSFLDGTNGNSMVIKFDAADDDFDDLTGGVIASSFTHKIPIKVEDANGNQESYYLLVSNT
tara:strand:+ start:55 stop:1350 length:1296 start_codon:yes stop_codon:yes gene_type:complete